MTKFDGEAEIARQKWQKIAQQFQIALQIRRKLEQNRPQATRRAQRIDRPQEEIDSASDLLEAHDVRDPLVGFASETETGRCRLHPIFECGSGRQTAECIVDLDAVETRRVMLQEFLLRQIGGIKARLPTRIREAGGPCEELRHSAQLCGLLQSKTTICCT